MSSPVLGFPDRQSNQSVVWSLEEKKYKTISQVLDVKFKKQKSMPTIGERVLLFKFQNIMKRLERTETESDLSLLHLG